MHAKTVLLCRGDEGGGVMTKRLTLLASSYRDAVASTTAEHDERVVGPGYFGASLCLCDNE